MKTLLVSTVVLAGACERDCPKPPTPEPCKDLGAAKDAATPTSSSLQRDTLEFVRLGYGDSHDLHVRSLQFRTECLSTTLMQQALRLVPDYNAFDGAKVAAGIESLRGEIMCWQFGREGSPVIYMEIPYWLGQAEKVCPAQYDTENAPPCDRPKDDRRLTDRERSELADDAKTLFQSLHADEIDFDQIATNTLRIWWD